MELPQEGQVGGMRRAPTALLAPADKHHVQQVPTLNAVGQFVVGTRRVLPMSIAVAVVGRAGLGIATDSIYLEMTDRTARVSTDRYKLVCRGERVASLVGLAAADGQALLPFLYEALGAGRSLEHVLGIFASDAAAVIARGAEHFVALGAKDSESKQVLQAVVAERDAEGTLRVIEASVEMTQASGIRIEPSILGPDGAAAYVALYGAYDPETARCSSTYAVSYELSLLRRQRPLPPRPRTAVPADLDPATLEVVARGIVDRAIEREALIARPPWWPVGVPVLAGPVHSARL